MKKLLVILLFILTFFQADAGKKEDRTRTLFNAIAHRSTKTIQRKLRKAPKRIRDNANNSPLHYAILRQMPEITCYLINKRKNDINHPNNEGDTALHWAAKDGDVEAVNLLIKHGANWAVKNKDGKTPFDIATNAMKNEENWDSYCGSCTTMAPFHDHIRTPCNHIFCKECLVAWHQFQSSDFTKKTDCPTCRVSLTHTSLRELQDQAITTVRQYLLDSQLATTNPDRCTTFMTFNAAIESLRERYISSRPTSEGSVSSSNHAQHENDSPPLPASPLMNQSYSDRYAQQMRIEEQERAVQAEHSRRLGTRINMVGPNNQPARDFEFSNS